jgi:hypothetical protein
MFGGNVLNHSTHIAQNAIPRLRLEMNGDIFIGRKAISNYLHVSWDTILKWEKTRGFPILREPGCQPILSVHAVRIWEAQRRKELKSQE